MGDVAFGFDAENLTAQETAEAQAAQMVTQVSDETIAAIRSVVVRSIREGIAPRDAARLIRDMVGMTERQAQAALNFRQQLIDEGLALSTVQDRTERYIRRKIRERALNIARTEIMTALNEGVTESWRQAVDRGVLTGREQKEWLVTPDDRLCPVCQPLDGQKVDMDEAFDTSVGDKQNPPAHPSCRCTVGLVPPSVSG